MGSSPRGKLYYGFPIASTEDESPLFPWGYDEYGEDDPDGWKDKYFDSLGINDIPYDKERYENDPAYKESVRGLWNKKRDAEKELGAYIGFAGYDGFSHYYIAAFELGSEWGEMTPVSLEIQPVWEFKIKQFCEITGIPYQQPQWYLTSLYF